MNRRLYTTISCLVLFLGIVYPAHAQRQKGSSETGALSSFAGDTILLKTSQIQLDEYNAQRPKTIIELQQFRETSSIDILDSGGKRGKATLINLNPTINIWFLLKVDFSDGQGAETYHLENTDPANQTIKLDPDYPQGIVIIDGNQKYNCSLWSEFSQSELQESRNDNKPYVPLCGGRLYLRNKTKGHKTTMEWATDFLRNYVAGGEKITVFVREQFFQDAFINTSKIISAAKETLHFTKPRPPGAPARALSNQRFKDNLLNVDELGINLENEAGHKALIGRWYPVKNLSGVFFSVIQPQLVAEEVIQSQDKLVNSLDDIESKALAYMIAFDLDQFEIGFCLGTEHPRVDWSDRVQQTVRNNSLPGPDGIGTVDPIVNTGMISPIKAKHVAATFVGGFKRYHGAFRYSDFAFKNKGSHYGFIENGVVFSKLQPGLATLVIYNDGTIILKTWTDKDNGDLARIRHARQNGVAIIDYDETTNTSKPGSRVKSWGLGNWSGSVEGRYRTLRSGIGLQEVDGYRFLIYGYFSTATPSAMARVFQAYQCRYAMMLDMNALEHTYLAVFPQEDSGVTVNHLINGMNVLDKSFNQQVVPRFVGYADNRDFFYLVRKKN